MSFNASRIFSNNPVIIKTAEINLRYQVIIVAFVRLLLGAATDDENISPTILTKFNELTMNRKVKE